MAILAFGLSGKLPLDHLEGLRVDDGLVVVLHVILRDLTLIGFHLLGQEVLAEGNADSQELLNYSDLSKIIPAISFAAVKRSSKLCVIRLISISILGRTGPCSSVCIVPIQL